MSSDGLTDNPIWPKQRTIHAAEQRIAALEAKNERLRTPLKGIIADYDGNQVSANTIMKRWLPQARAALAEDLAKLGAK